MVTLGSLIYHRRRRLSILLAMRPAAPTDIAPNPVPFCRRLSILPVNDERFIGVNRSPLLRLNPPVAMSRGRIPPL